MLVAKKNIVPEKSLPILIQQTSPAKNSSPKGEYSLKRNFFDPSKSSPPNEFMLKLRMRMSKYYDFSDDERDDDSVEIK